MPEVLCLKVSLFVSYLVYIFSLPRSRFYILFKKSGVVNPVLGENPAL